MASTVTITSIHGAQQRAIANAFAAAGWQVRGTSRRPGDGNMVADLDSGKGLEAAFADVDVVVFTPPQDHRQGAIERMAENVARAAERSRAGRLVFNTAAIIDDAGEGELFESLRRARATIRSASFASVVLQPTIYMDNLLAPWSLPAMHRDGVLAHPAPEQARIAWLSHRSLGDAALAAAAHPHAPGRVFDIGGPQALTGPELAERLGRRLKRELKYVRVPLDAFASGLNQALGAPAGDRIAQLYRHLDRYPDALARGAEASTALGFTPESFEAFADRVDWQLGPG